MVISSTGVVSYEHTRLEQPQPSTYPRTIQNNLFICLNNNIDHIDDNDCQNTVTKLRQAVHTIYTFIITIQYLNFITDMKNEYTILITSGTLSQSIPPLIHDSPKLDAIYIFCLNKLTHEQWAKQ